MRLFAYLDPGSASALLAGIIAGFAALMTAMRTFGRSAMSKLMFWRKDEASSRPETPAAPSTEDEPAERG